MSVKKTILLCAYLFVTVFQTVTLFRAQESNGTEWIGLGLVAWVVVSLYLETRLPSKSHMRVRWIALSTPAWVLFYIGLVACFERVVFELGRIYRDLSFLSWDARFFEWIAPQGQLRLWLESTSTEWVWRVGFVFAMLVVGGLLTHWMVASVRSKHWSADLHASRLNAVWIATSVSIGLQMFFAFLAPALGPARAFPDLFELSELPFWDLNMSDAFPALWVSLSAPIAVFGLKWTRGFARSGIAIAFVFSVLAGLFLGFYYLASVFAAGVCAVVGLQAARWRSVE